MHSHVLNEADMNVNIVASEFKKTFGLEPEVVVSAPGRLDFLNTHQDYKGLPVVSVGINLRTYIAGRRTDEKSVEVYSGNLLDEGGEHFDKIELTSLEILPKQKWFGNYLRAALIALLQKGYKVGGAKAWIRSWVPIASGLGSSGTLLVAFIGFLNELFNLGLAVKDVAELAYVAEHDVLGIPCGRLDQYAAAFGNVSIIETVPPYNVESISFNEGIFAVIDSGIRHSTADIHPKRQKEIEIGLEKLMSIAPADLRRLLGYRYWEPKWSSLTIEQLQPYLHELDEKAKNRILYTIKAHNSTMLAIKVLRGYKPSYTEVAKTLEIDHERAKEIVGKGKIDIIGNIMTYQHNLLSSLYDVSLPEIDKIVEEFIDNGALGAKLSGAGLGGCVIALFKDVETAHKALSTMLSKGIGTRGWIVKVDKGITRHK
ncbi:MAG: galactokinase family protein [Ignisphaera sp.]